MRSLNEDTNDPEEVSRDTLNVLFNDLAQDNDGKLDILLNSNEKSSTLIRNFVNGVYPCPKISYAKTVLLNEFI